MICPYCQNEHPDSALFCPATGKKIILSDTCPNCGEKVEQDWKICGYCGQAIQAGSAPQVVQRSTQIHGKHRRPSRRWGCLIGGVIGLVVLLAILLVVDTFTLHGVGRLTGRYDAAAAALPDDSVLFISVNFLNARPDKLDRITKPFSQGSVSSINPSEADNASPGMFLVAANAQATDQDIFTQFVEELENELALSIPDDLTPWAGQYGGVALVPIKYQDGEKQYDDLGIVFAIETRSPNTADSFLWQWAARLTDIKEIEYTRDTYRGITIYTPSRNEELTFARMGWVVLAANDGDVLRATIDKIKQGSTLGNTPAFSNLIRKAPASRTATIFLNGQLVRNSAGGFGPEIINVLWSTIGLDIQTQEILMSLTVINEGLQMDVLSAYQDGKQPIKGDDMLENFKKFSSNTAEYFPEETAIFFTSPSIYDQRASSPIYLQQSEWIVTEVIDPQEVGIDPNGPMTIYGITATFEELREGVETPDGKHIQWVGNRRLGQIEIKEQPVNDAWSLDRAFFNRIEMGMRIPMETGLKPAINQEWGFGITLNDQSGIQFDKNIFLEMLLVASIEDSQFVQMKAENLANRIEEQGISIRQKETEQGAFYQITPSREDFKYVFGHNDEVIAYLLGGDLNSIQELFNKEGNLAGNPNYRQTWRAFPSGMKPILYIDIEGVSEATGLELGEIDPDYQVIEPVKRIAAALRVDSDLQTRSTIIFFLKEP